MRLTILFILLFSIHGCSQNNTPLEKELKSDVSQENMIIISDTSFKFSSMKEINNYFSRKLDTLNELKKTNEYTNSINLKSTYDSLFYDYGVKMNLCRIKFIETTPKVIESFKHLLYLSKDRNIPKERLVNLYNSYSDEIKKSAIGTRVQITLDSYNISPSSHNLQNFIAYNYTDVNDRQFKISEIDKNFLLIDFWASWCGPCRYENKKLLGIYNHIDTSKIAIVGISLDVVKSKWIKAIKSDKYPWINITDFKGWDSPVVKQLSITSIPLKFLITKDGDIIQSNPEISYLKKLGLIKD